MSAARRYEVVLAPWADKDDPDILAGLAFAQAEVARIEADLAVHAATGMGLDEAIAEFRALWKALAENAPKEHAAIVAELTAGAAGETPS